MQRLSLFLACFMAGLVVWLSLSPASDLPSLSHSDKLYHIIAYCAITGSFGVGLPRIPLIWIISLSMVFGLGIEIAQYSMGHGRTFSWLDALANLTGAVLAGLLVQYLARGDAKIQT